MSTVDKIVEFLSSPPPPAAEVVTLPREVAERLVETAEAHHSAFADVQAIRGTLAEPKAELWAVHSVGPGEVWPTLTREHAEQEAQELRASVKLHTNFDPQVNVIPSPWSPREHFKLLAEETAEHRDDCLDAYREKEAAFKAACADLAAIQALLGLEGAYSGVDTLLRAITELWLKSGVIVPLPVQRDVCGHWTHPAWPQDGEENAIPKSWFKTNGLQVFVVEFEHDAPEELTDRYFEHDQPDACKDWEPSQPVGEGWFVFSIHETEDGPVCIWVRHGSQDGGKNA